MKTTFVVLIVSALFPSVGYCQDTAKPLTSTENQASKTSTIIEELTDYDYAWDQFSHRGRMTWACRGLQSGRFVGPELCTFKEKVDTHWPDKKIPGHWRP